MKTELVFKLEREPNGYRQVFSPNCKINIVKTAGIVFLGYDKCHPVGHFENLRREGEVVLADVTIFEKLAPIEYRFEYAIEGGVVKKNENDECEEVNISSVSALMPFKD